MNDGWITIDFTIKPHLTNQPRNTPHLTAHFWDALGIGFRVLRYGARIGGLSNPDIQNCYFLENTRVSQGERLQTFLICMTQIEQHGYGVKHAKDIGKKYAREGQEWRVWLGVTPDSENSAIARAIAEWADGDAVAAHIAYKNNYFCTRDEAKTAGTGSILSLGNRAWINSKYDVCFVSPEELVTILEQQ